MMSVEGVRRLRVSIATAGIVWCVLSERYDWRVPVGVGVGTGGEDWMAVPEERPTYEVATALAYREPGRRGRWRALVVAGATRLGLGMPV